MPECFTKVEESDVKYLYAKYIYYIIQYTSEMLLKNYPDQGNDCK